MKSKLYAVAIPPDVASIIDDILEREKMPPSDFLRSAISRELAARGVDCKLGLVGVYKGKRTDMKTPSGRAKALENLTIARASRKRVGRRKKEDASPAVVRRLTPREEMELLVRTSLPEIQKILDEMRAQSARARRSGSSAA